MKKIVYIIFICILFLNTKCAAQQVTITDNIKITNKREINLMNAAYIAAKNHEYEYAMQLYDIAIVIFKNNDAEKYYLMCQDKLKMQKSGIPNELIDYMYNIQTSVRAKWNPPVSKKKNSVEVRLLIDRHGNILYKSIIKECNNKKENEAVLKAIADAAPFGEFPKGVKDKVIGIDFTLNNNRYEQHK